MASGQQSVVSGGVDALVKMWDLRTRTCTRTINASCAWTIQYDEDRNMIMSGDLAGNIFVWWPVDEAASKDAVVRKRSILSSEPILCLASYGTKLMSGEGNGRIRIWNKDTISSRLYESTSDCDVVMRQGGSTLKAVRCLSFDDEKIIFGDENGTLQILFFHD